MSGTRNILVLGASYGSLLATKLLPQGHKITLVCRPSPAQLINREGTVLRIPVKGREGLVEIRSHDLPGQLSAGAPGEVNPSEYDLVALAMQEPQYRVPAVRPLLAAVATDRVPCLSIMNMPPYRTWQEFPDSMLRVAVTVIPMPVYGMRLIRTW